MRNQQIRLTEEDLHILVEDAVKSYLINEGIEEGFWGGLRNVWQGAKRKNFNVGQTYKAGSWASSFNSCATTAQNALEKMRTIAKETKNPTIAKQLGSIKKMLGRAAAGYTKMAAQVAKGTPMNTSVQDPWEAQAAKPTKTKVTKTKTSARTANAAVNGVENGKFTLYDQNGNPITSSAGGM